MKKKILIVDDVPDDLVSMRTILERAGYAVSTATSGASALKALRTGPPHLILIDIEMPALSGYDLLRILREKLNHKVKMLFVTIVPSHDVEPSDIDDIIHKPFSPQTLVARVTKALSGKP